MKRALIALLLAATPAAAAGSLTDAAARRFLADQERAWNARRLDAYFRGFTPDAVFIDQTRTPKEVIVYGRSTVGQAHALARRGPASTEHGAIRTIALAPDGRSARVLGDEVTIVATPARVRRICARTEQTLILRGGRILSGGQTDTIVRCPPTR